MLFGWSWLAREGPALGEHGLANGQHGHHGRMPLLHLHLHDPKGDVLDVVPVAWVGHDQSLGQHAGAHVDQNVYGHAFVVLLNCVFQGGVQPHLK